jgi:hypothetical protein
MVVASRVLNGSSIQLGSVSVAILLVSSKWGGVGTLSAFGGFLPE